MFQFPVLYPGLDVAGNLGFPLRNRGWRRAAARRRVEEVAELLALGSLLDKKPRALSLFEKQMTAIGRALVRPDVALVLLDEPLTAVEPAAKWQLRQALQRVRRELGLTMIYVTHDQTEALTFAERITMLHQGRGAANWDAGGSVRTPRPRSGGAVHRFAGHELGSGAGQQRRALH